MKGGALRLLRRALLASALAFASAALAARPAPLRLEAMTSPEVRAAIAAGATTILVPIGGTEQNGPHMVLGKHNARAAALAEAIAGELGHALVAPTIAYVPEGRVEPPVGHMRFAGTISIPEDAFEKTLEGAAASFRKHGFRDMVLLGDHGGYRRSLDRVASRLNARWAASGFRVHTLPEYYDPTMAHAGRADTAFAMAVPGEPLVRWPLPEFERDAGAAEDPLGATGEEGRAIFERTVAKSVEALKKALARGANRGQAAPAAR